MGIYLSMAHQKVAIVTHMHHDVIIIIFNYVILMDALP